MDKNYSDGHRMRSVGIFSFQCFFMIPKTVTLGLSVNSINIFTQRNQGSPNRERRLRVGRANPHANS